MATGIDLNRGSDGVNLPPQVTGEIWQKAVESSAVMQLARQIALPGAGLSIPMITGDAEADWVNETDEKPVDRPSVGSKQITAHKLALIVPFSNEFKRDLPALYRELARRLPSALGRKFDATIFHGSAPGDNFDVLSDATVVGIKPGSGADKGSWKNLVATELAIAESGYELDGWALSPQARALLLSAVDSGGRPLYATDNLGNGQIASLLGHPVYGSKAVSSGATIGFAGDWSSAVWGSVEGISIGITEDATISDGVEVLNTSGTDTVTVPKTLNLWQRNMFAVRVEAHLGFAVEDKAAFRKITTAAVS